MRVTTVAIGLAFGLMSSFALADDSKPIELTVEQMDKITAGVGANNIAVFPWEILGPMGFKPAHNVAAEPGADHADALNGVIVPTKNPNGVPDGHPGCPITYCSSPPGQL